jgi:mannose-1-phosphate guanylyltransferase
VPENKTCTRVLVIMAGGSGERFWPLSRACHPKQLLRLTSESESMLTEAAKRMMPLIPPDHLYVQTAAHLREAIVEAGIGIPAENVLAEPCKRNTSGCLAYAAAHLLAKHGEQVTMAVLTADQKVDDADLFLETVNAAMDAAERDAVLVTIGIPPTYPSTGYGYIQASAGTAKALKVQAFHEKPDAVTAQQYVQHGMFFWNSGMFFWRLSSFLSELDAANPRLAQATRDMAEAMRRNDEARVRTVFEGIEDLSIDYALMERAQNVAMVPAQFDWDDVGTWASLDRTRPADAHGNITFGNPVLHDCRNSIVYNAAGEQVVSVGVAGMENVVVVVTEDAVLVLPKDRAEEVKAIVQELKKRGSTHV